MSEDNETTPPTKQERLGQWLCMLGVVFLLLGFFATANKIGWLVGGASLVTGGYLLLHKGEKSRQTKAPPPPKTKAKSQQPQSRSRRPVGPDDDPAFMANLSQRIRRPDSTD